MKKILPLLVLLFGVFAAQAQQEHQYTQFMYNKLLINPGYAGARGTPFVTAIYRNQWAGFDGSPKSALVSFNSPFLSNRVGVGVTVSSQQAGFQRDFFGNLAYSYDLIARDAMSLRIGVMGSVRNLALDFTKAKPGAPDNSIEQEGTSELLGNVGAGIYATFADKAYVGFSVPRIYSNTFGFNQDTSVTLLAKEYRHYYGMAGIILPVGEGVNLMPSALIKYVSNAPISADLNMSLEVKQKITMGLSYRLGGEQAGDSVDLLLYWQATSQLGIGAAYDFSLSPTFRDNSAGSFEILLQADLKKKKKNMSNPRFFL